MTFMWRRYTPKTNRLSLARIFSSHLPLEGKLLGVDGAEPGGFGQDAHEADDAGSHGLVGERILRHQPDNLAARADHDLGIKGKPACQFGAELRPGDGPPDHEGARRADVDGIEVLQLNA